MKSGVYKIKNKINGKVYIGSSVNLTKRKRDHFWCLKRGEHCNDHLQKAYIKYGHNNFEFEIIEECPVDVCLIREQYYIDLYKSTETEIGYNICPNSASVLGRRHSEATIEKIRKSNTGKKLSKERRAYLAKINTGKVASFETKEKMRQSQRMRTHPESVKRKMSNSHKGKVLSEEHRIKLSNAHKNSDKKGVKIAQYTLDGECVKVHKSGREAAKSVGFAYTNLYAHLKGDRKQIRGFIFKRHTDAN